MSIEPVLVAPAVFNKGELDGLPDPVRRHLAQAIAVGTPLVTEARLTMRGRIKLGRWLPFRAQQTLDPHKGFIWSARVAGVITGSDRVVDGEGSMAWKLAGLVPIVSVDGADVTRSSAGRGGAEAVWLPTALLPRFGVTWSAQDATHVRSHLDHAGTPVTVDYTLDGEGRILSLCFDRWGDPAGSSTWGWHRFGGEITAHRTFGGLTIPSAGRLGWGYGTDAWPAGAFFRFEIVGLELRPGPQCRDRFPPEALVGDPTGTNVV